jgi:DUF971 family protein
MSHSTRVLPLALDLDRQRELRIQWADGHESTLPLPQLRRACPCAACRAAREERERGSGGLTVLPQQPEAAAMAQARAAELVGNYALKITWADGHNTGIYDFALLRQLDPTAP